MSKYIANAFQIPNAVVDDLMSRLSPNAFKCYVLIVRKTTGWGKSSDKISISQFQAIAGIKKRDTVISALAELEKLNLILPVKKAGLVNEFRLNKLPEITHKPVPKMVTTTSPENGDDPKNGTSPDNRTRVVPKMVTTTSPENGDTQNPLTKPTRQNTPIYPPIAEAAAVVAGNAGASPADPNGSAGVSGDGVGEQPGSASAKRSAKPKRFDAPVDDLVAIYNEVAAGVLPTVQKITDARRKHVNARWLQFKNSRDPNGNLRYADEQSGLLWWRSFFRKVLKNERWAGGSGIEWTADFDWIVKEANFIKILEWKPANQGNRHAA